jgi:RNA polymerase sigma-70 factor (ECF subfamily)
VEMTTSMAGQAQGQFATSGACLDIAPAFVPEGRPQMPKLAAVDSERFDRMVAGNLDFIWRCLRRRGIPSSDVDDAVQQVFIVAASKLSGIIVGSERAFLFATASRIAANAGRMTRRRNRTIHFVAEPEASDAPSQEELSDRLRARILMDRVLGEMPRKLREVFVLFELEELRVAEVAELLSMPMGTVGSRLRRARRDFRKRSRRLNALTLVSRAQSAKQ